MSNTITAYFKGRKGVAESLYQNDYGMVMAFDGIELPAHFDCYFSIQNQEEAVPGVGADNRVAIPNSVLANPGKVEIHIPLHTGSSDSEVEYVVYFRVIGRARPVDDGTPAQMTAIEQALALLQNPITNIEQIVNEALDFTGDTFAEMQEQLDADQAAFQDDMGDRADAFEAEIRGDIADVESDFDNLNAQFQTAVGALTVDDELLNVRVGDDNVIYATAGEAVRKQFSALKSDLSESSYNKFNKYTVEKGKTVLSDGTVTNANDYDLSDYIPTNGLTTIYTEWSGNYFQFRVAVYNSDKVFQERKTSGVLSVGKGVFTLTNDGYIRIVLQAASNSDGQTDVDTLLVVDGQDVKPYVPSIIAVDHKERQATEHIKDVEFFTNLLDESDTANVRTGGFFGSSGWTSNANFNTYFVPIEPYKTYQTNIPTQACAACDANKNFLSYVPTKADGTWYTSAPSARYAGIAFKADLSNRGKHMFIDGESVPTWYIRPNTAVLYDENAKAYFEDTAWRGKSWYSFGTSMEDIGIGGASGNVGTSGKWPLYVDGVSGLIRNNQAVGGGGICPSTSGQGLVKTRVLACPYDVDLVTIEAGPNDWTEITLGEVGDIGDDTFLGNLRQCYEYLTEHTRARVVSICISNSNDNGGKPFYKNQFGYTYRDYMNGVRELSKYYGITNIDVVGDLLGWGRRTADLLKDHIHYTELGGAVVGEFIWNKLKLVEPFPRFTKEEASL